MIDKSLKIINNEGLTETLVLKRDSGCREKDSCATTCYPNCNSGQTCVYSVRECENCLMWQCIDNNKIQLQVSATEFSTNNNNNSKKKTILIAGLATGLACIIVGTIGVIVFYKRQKKRRRPNFVENYNDDEKYFSIEPLTPIKPVILPPRILDWTHQVL